MSGLTPVMRGIGIVLLLASLVGLAPVGAHAKGRLALVVGNGAYADLPTLKNATKDAGLVAETLRRLDFEVVLAKDLTKAQFDHAFGNVRRRLSDGTVEMFVFYYAGHAYQADGDNFLHLLRKDGAETLKDLDDVRLSQVVDDLQGSAPRLSTALYILDACRTPLPARLALREPGRIEVAELQRGLVRIQRRLGSMTIFSTQPGATAIDGAGENGPFALAFSRHAMAARTELGTVFKRIRADVMEQTQGRQVPDETSDLVAEVYLSPRRAPPLFAAEPVVRLRPAVDAPQDLNLPVAEQPEGGEVTVTVARSPDHGTLLLGNRRLAAGDTISGRQLAELAYRPAPEGPSLQQVRLQVEDAWGFVGHSVVTLLLDAQVEVARPAPPSIGRIELSATAVIGVDAPLAFDRAPSLPQSPVRLRMAGALARGHLMLDGRPIDRDRTITIEDLAKLSYASPRLAGAHGFDVAFVAENPARGEVRLTVAARLDRCDELAGAPLDGQGAGTGVLPDQMRPEAALAACAEAVRRHPTIARFPYQLARALRGLSRDGEAVAQMRGAVTLGHVQAKAVLGGMMIAGYGGRADAAGGLALVEEAYRAGDIHAAHMLGSLHEAGQIVPRDRALALRLFEVAASKGHTFAMNGLGQLHYFGRGVARDRDVAMRYWTASSERGDMYGINNLAIAHRDGSPSPDGLAQAMAGFRQAAALGHPGAFGSLGWAALSGLGMARDVAAACGFFRSGAERGDAFSAYRLARLLGEQACPKSAENEATRLLAWAASGSDAAISAEADAALRALPAATVTRALAEVVGQLEVRPRSGSLEARADALIRGTGQPRQTSAIGQLIILERQLWLLGNPRTDVL